jgi:phosphate transport system substrate-binding protein
MQDARENVMQLRYLAPVLAVAAAAMFGAPAVASETVRIGGTGGALELLRLAAKPLRASENMTIEVLPSFGTAGALRAVTVGAIDIAISARALTPQETNPGLIEVPFARTPLVFITSHPNPEPLTTRDLVAAFAAQDPRWPDGSRVNLILRPRSDSDTELMCQFLPGMREALKAARQRPDLPIAATDQDSIDLAERLPGSLVQAGFGQIVSEKRNLRFVVLDGVAPSLETMQDGRYPHQKTFAIAYAPSRSGPAERLLTYLRSPSGTALMREAGFLPID